MRAFWSFVVGGFKRHARYRAAIAAAFFTNSVFGFIRASLMLAAIAGASGSSIGGYDRAAAATYVWLGQGLLGPIMLWGWGDVTERIRTGDIAMDFLRPTHPLVQWCGADFGRAASQFLPRFVPMLVVGALTTGIVLPRSVVSWLLFGVSVMIAVGIAHLMVVLVNLTGLWLTDARGLVNLYTTVGSLLCGLFVPVAWFPGWLRVIANATPLPSMFQAPINVAMGLTVDGWSPLQTVAKQAGWLVVLVGVAVLVLNRGSRRVVIHGG